MRHCAFVVTHHARAVTRSRDVFSDERRETHDEMLRVHIAHERQAPETGKRVLALRATFAHDRVKTPAERTKRIRVLVVAADFSANRDDVLFAERARLQDEPFHRVQIHSKTGRSARGRVVQFARAHDGGSHREQFQSALFESTEIGANMTEQIIFGFVRFAFARKTLLRVIAVARTRFAKLRLGVERQTNNQIGRRLRRHRERIGERARHASPSARSL